MTSYFFQLDMYIDEREVLVGKGEATESGWLAAMRGFRFPATVEERVQKNGSTRLEIDEVAECLSWLVDVDEEITPDAVIDLCMCLWQSTDEDDLHLVSEVKLADASNPEGIL